MSGASYFRNARNFVAKNTTFNTYVSGIDALQFLYEHAATGAMHDSDERYPPPMCHPGTREVVIVRIKDWYGFQTRPDKPIMWVHAPAGYGKTAIAGTISKLLEEVEGLDFSPLGATFHFWRTSPERNSPARFIITIAYQLAMSVPELTPHIENAVKRNPMILRKTLEVQLMKLIVEPFKALGELENMPNRLVIVDGLDECINSDQEYTVDRRYAEDQEKVQIRILDIIHNLQSHRLPLSFLILSRPEAWIGQHMQSASFERIVEAVDLYAVGDHMKDTETYIRAELSRIAARIRGDGTPERGDEEWPGEWVVQTFVQRTNGHMLYASTIIRHIDNPYDDPRKLLERLPESYAYGNFDLAHSSPFSSLNALYMHIMQSCPKSNRPLMIEVLAELYECAELFHPNVDVRRAVAVLDRLAGRVPGQGFRALRPLHAVLRLSGTGKPDDRKTHFSPFIHTSFSDFLHNSRLSLEFAIDQQNGYRRILDGCLDCMSKMTSQSETDTDHYRFAVRVWPILFYVATSELPHAEYLETMRKLLSIDLLACSIKALVLQNSIDDLASCESLIIDTSPAYKSGHFNLLVRGSSLRIFKSEPLIQQAVTHLIPGPRTLTMQSSSF
ncbi:hypothetical protein EST38_g5023 [Candolleomyces aberdarensis]|uniref:Nephrocystin 3-like N-terminal domain-containing protein n=1 Tax=Candolleomyces aberdarensis TaxID=2316362 RepID=A0A4Q2DL51_9AGAR|nr:hypothetical protein EST38_g5023 [Candolleomyces aberdarensis]